MKRSGDSKHPCQSPTPTVNGRDLTLPTRTQTSEQEYSDLTASNRRPSTLYSRKSPQSFWRGTQSHAFSKSTKRVDVFGILPRFLKNLLESENLGCSAMAGTKTALGIIQLWFNYFATSFFKTLGNVNVNYLKIPEKHCGPHKTSRGPRV